MASADTPSAQLQATLRWIEAFNTRSADAVGLLLTDDYEHTILPASLGRRVMKTKKDYLEYLGPVLGSFKVFHVTVNDVVEQQGKVAVHASSQGISGTDAPYANEYTLFVETCQVEDGSYKISKVKEFVDSRFSAEFYAAERKRVSDASSKAA